MITEEDKSFHAFKLLTETPNSAPISLNVSPASTLYVSALELVSFWSVAPSILIFCPGNIFVESILRSEEHTSELQSRFDLVCRLLLEKKKNDIVHHTV